MSEEMIYLAANYINMNMLILIPTLFGLGLIIKHTSFIKDKYIPVMLLPLGIAGAVGLGLHESESVLQGVIQGILITTVTVYGNEVVKQLKKKGE